MVRTYLAGFLAAVLSVYAPALAPARAADAPRLVLLGTAGGPTPKKSRAAPAQAIQVGDRIYVVDCGNGVARQLVLAGLPLKQIRHVFLTHHHSDHAADVVTLPLLALAGGLEQTITIHGPRPLARTVRAGLRQFAPDIEVRREDEGRPDLRRLIAVREVKKEGVVLTDGPVTVRAARVAQPPPDDSFAYRFDVVVESDAAT